MYRKIFLTISALAVSVFMAGGKTPGKIFYTLPSTTVSMEVEALCENFHAGPYAAYAMKYLGIDARQQDQKTYTVRNIRLVPRIEADFSETYEISSGSSTIDAADMLKLTSQGLISIPGDFDGRTEVWSITEDSPVDSPVPLTGTSFSFAGDSFRGKVSVMPSLQTAFSGNGSHMLA